jgi:hypothetical protein
MSEDQDTDGGRLVARNESISRHATLVGSMTDALVEMARSAAVHLPDMLSARVVPIMIAEIESTHDNTHGGMQLPTLRATLRVEIVDPEPRA